MAKSCTVFLGNIPYDATEEELRQIFGRAGQVDSLRLVYDKDTRQPKGYGFCDFVDQETAMNAIRTLNDVEYNGRRLRLDLADNALRSREGKLPDVRLPVPAAMPTSLPALPAPEAQPRPSLPPASVGQLTAPQPAAASGRPLPPPPGGLPPGSGAVPIPGQPAADPGQASPEAVIAAVSAHTEIAQAMAAMPPAQLQLCLGNMQRLAQESPEGARALLQDNPQLCYALLQAQLLLGLTTETVLPPDMQEMQQLRAEAQRRPSIIPGMAPRPGVPRPVMTGGLMNFPGLITARPGSLAGHPMGMVSPAVFGAPGARRPPGR